MIIIFWCLCIALFVLQDILPVVLVYPEHVEDSCKIMAKMTFVRQCVRIYQLHSARCC